jgi:hypothetical protein
MHPYLLSSHQLIVSIMAVAPEGKQLELSTVFTCIFFGTNFLLCLLFQLVRRLGLTGGKEKVEGGGKKLSKPVEGTLEW